jgi:hypothetical protein
MEQAPFFWVGSQNLDLGICCVRPKHRSAPTYILLCSHDQRPMSCSAPKHHRPRIWHDFFFELDGRHCSPNRQAAHALRQNTCSATRQVPAQPASIVFSQVWQGELPLPRRLVTLRA